MYYVGFDLSISSTGVAVIDEQGYLIETIAIKTKPDDYRGPQGFANRLVFITDMLMSVLREYRPAKLAIEQTLTGTAGYGVQDRAKLIGVLQYRIATEIPEHNDPLYVYPSSLKKIVTGSGKADKADIKKAIDGVFGYDLGLETSDQYDALGLALVAGAWFDG